MLVLVLCQPDAAKKVSLVCPSLVAYPDAMATITVAIIRVEKANPKWTAPRNDNRWERECRGVGRYIFITKSYF